MPPRVFFSFHYQKDVWRANQIRNSHIVAGTAAAGFQDASLWEEAKRRGGSVVRALIDEGLKGTSVTVVLIGSETANRQYVEYEIEKSVERGNGLLGIYVHNLKDQHGKTCAKGAVPAGLLKRRIPVYEWDREKFGQWVEEAHSRRPVSQTEPSYWVGLAPFVAAAVILLAFWFKNRGSGDESGAPW